MSISNKSNLKESKFKLNKIINKKTKQNAKHLTLVRLVVVPCPPVVEVLIKRPDTKYQLGFSVQDGIVCLNTFISNNFFS